MGAAVLMQTCKFPESVADEFSPMEITTESMNSADDKVRPWTRNLEETKGVAQAVCPCTAVESQRVALAETIDGGQVEAPWFNVSSARSEASSRDPDEPAEWRGDSCPPPHRLSCRE